MMRRRSTTIPVTTDHSTPCLHSSRRCYHPAAGEGSSFTNSAQHLGKNRLFLAPAMEGYDHQITRSLRDRQGQGRHLLAAAAAQCPRRHQRPQERDGPARAGGRVQGQAAVSGLATSEAREGARPRCKWEDGLGRRRAARRGRRRRRPGRTRPILGPPARLF